MILSDAEKAMLDGARGPAHRKAMELLVRYGEALGAERFVEVRNVATVTTVTNPIVRKVALEHGMDGVFSRFNLDSDEIVATPTFEAATCQLIHGIYRAEAREFGVAEDAVRLHDESELFFGRRGVQMLSTCTPYQVGNVPTLGEHCAWMESSAVVYCNSVLGGRTNTEGRESTSAAAVTGRIPYWGLHQPENRFGDLVFRAEIEIESMRDWGLFGYHVGQIAEDGVPVLEGVRSTPNLPRLKHFGASAASSGGVELFHIPGVTPEAQSVEQALRPGAAPQTHVYGAAERRLAYERTQLRRLRSERRFRDARMPARFDRAGLGGGAVARRQARQHKRQSVDPRAARNQGGRRPQRLHRDDRKRGRTSPERHLPGDQPHPAQRREGRRHGLRQAGALSAGDRPRHAGVVRLFGGLRQCRVDRPLVGRVAMIQILLQGRCVVPGKAKGEALVSREAISGWGGMDFNTGVITERLHPLYGRSFAGKVLVFMGAKGSSGWSHYFNLARHAGVAPCAMLFNRTTTKVALGAVVSRTPAITDFDRDPLDVIETGDWVELDATIGEVKVTKGASRP